MVALNPAMNSRRLICTPKEAPRPGRKPNTLRRDARSGFGSNQTVQRRDAGDSADLCFEAHGPQQITHRPTGVNNAQRNAMAYKLGMQLVQHPGAGEVDIGRGGKITRDQAVANIARRYTEFVDIFQSRSNRAA